MKLLLIIFLLIILLTGCIVKKNAVLIGYEGNRMLLVTTDTISFGSKVKGKGKIGDGYTVLYRGNKVLRVQTVKK